MSLNNQDFHSFQREFLIGPHESSSRKTKETRLDTIIIYVYEDTSSRTDVHARVIKEMILADN